MAVATQFLVFCGPPGVGKGTQALRVAADLGIPQISTGDMLREVAASGTELGRKLQAVMDTGELASDDIVLAAVRQRLDRGDCGGGCIFDGFPRTVAQAEALSALLREQGTDVSAVLWIDAPASLLVERLLGRGRDDDNEATIRQRLRVYADRTAALREYYQAAGLLREIDGSGSIEEVAGRVASALA